MAVEDPTLRAARMPVATCRYESFRICSMTSRGPRSGSDSTRHSLLNNIVSREVAEYAGHFGSFGVLGSPVRAKAAHAALVFSASAYASGIFEMSGPAILMLLNTN